MSYVERHLTIGDFSFEFKVTLECMICGESHVFEVGADVGPTEAANLALADAVKHGWRCGDSERYQSVGPVCPDCQQSEDGLTVYKQPEEMDEPPQHEEEDDEDPKAGPPTLAEFMSEPTAHPRNSYLNEAGFEQLYVKKPVNFFGQDRVEPCLTVGNLIVEEENSGAVKMLVRTVIGAGWAIVFESILNDAFLRHLIRAGFSQIPRSIPPSVMLRPGQPCRWLDDA